MTTSNFPIDFPVGFGFRPTDQELVDYYLKNKLLGNDSTIICEVDFYKFEPEELRAISISRIKSVDPEWFFLYPREYKYAKNKRINRETPCGFWKSTGKERKIMITGTNKVIAIKKTLVYYKGRAPNDVKTNWIKHEYDNITFKDNQRTFVLCRLMEKVENKAEEETNTMLCDEGEPSRHMSSDNENEPYMVDQNLFETPEEEDMFVSSLLTDGE